MASRGRGVDRGRGRGGVSAGGGPGERGSRSPIVNLGRGLGGTPPSLARYYPRGGSSSDRDGGRGGFVICGGTQRGRGQARIFMHDRQADIDPRIADNSDKTLVASFNSAGDLGSQPLRPDFGTDGKEVKLRTNFFPVQLHQQIPSLKLYRYNVAIAPPHGAATHRVRRRIFDLAERTTAWAQAGMTGRVVHDDSATLFSAILLPQPLTIRVPYHDEDASGPPRHANNEVYTLAIMFVQELETGHLQSYLAGRMQYRNYDLSPVASALNIILTSLPRKIGIIVGRNQYFSRPVAEPFRLGGGVEAWKGIYYASVRPTYKQLMVKVDVCVAPFYTPGNLVCVMNAFQDAFAVARMGTLFRGVRIEAIHLGYRRIIKKLVPLTARTCSFDTPEYGRVTVEDYFRRKYNIRLEYPNLQLVEVREQTESYLPAELCNILPGQPFRRLNDQQTVIMTAVACQSARIRGETTIKQLHHLLGLDVITPELESFGITIGPDMAVIPGRILSKPSITYASSAIASIGDRASWNIVGVKFAVGARLDNWAVLVIKDGAAMGEFAGTSDGDLHEVVSAFRQMCNASGMHVTADPTYAIAQLPRREPSADPMRREAMQTIKDALLNVRPKPALVLIMLANGDNAVYEGIKHLCDVRLDVATVCVQSAKIRKRNPHYLANVALKVNMKLGGVNHKLDGNGGEWLKSAPTMVVGVDVTHPNPGSAVGCPSIGAVVASVDSDFAQYPVALNIQEPRREMLTDLKSMMIDRLKLFQSKNNGKLPKRILIYRSGVSESLFDILRQEELPLIMEAFKAFSHGEPYRPKFTIVVCSKSRHVRFYPTEQDNAAVDGNPLPGTVVDRGITAIYDFDFFLQSHGSAGVQGTTRPTRYYVVYDDIGFKADEIQGVTNALSYMFAPATQAVSLASPAYYADAACKRGRCYLRKLFHGYVGEDGTTASGSQTGSGSATEQDVMQEARRLWGWGVAGAALRETMFYL